MKIKDIKIIDILQDGRGVGKADSKVYFIEKAIFGEICDIEITNEKKNFIEAKKIKTKKQSCHYKQPPCPYYYECGGCSIMDINYQSQIDLKKNLIKNALEKSSKIKIDDIEILKSKELGYRNKIRLKITKEGNLAYNKKYSNDLVEIKDCLLAKNLIRESLGKIENITKDISERYPNSLEEITIRANDKEILLNIKIKDEKIIPYIKNKYKDSSYNINLINKKENINISGKNYLYYNLLDKKFKISMNDFYQVNDYMTEKLYKTAKNFLGENQKVLDLFCGSATSSIAINNDHVVGIEINKNAIKDAKENANLNGLKDYKFIAKNANYIDHKFIKKEKIDAIVVDPPRAGLDKEIIKTIAKTKINKIVYISCNPQTLARDIKRFQNQGYKLEKIKGCDMFSETMHVETVALLYKLNTEHHLDIEIGEDELSEIDFSKDATYGEIKKYVLDKYGLKVSSLYIAQIKRKHGLIERENYNFSKKENQRVPNCPEEKEKAIEDALEHFGMI
ncbi:MAG: 23S rRNA (uracil(1939)-C(5))-methyltransferase RlmD [Anaerococcus hydrogenalis]|uniref:23S rRNA (uracil(1939)-C(5))-methyltransferase RlmD n=1 Tax=Anaerococcus hydrogenalis TaxID=33029 RepID=UPI00290C000B|nr:23S rRNA (uracil(1939)-C(5))-methyltransferase RlmD [Anaerococcus hydrogenalis]MDU3687292.1 23S rRNA (uracil(1939)-C(5))-methyltransferase RlmD [Anaerococcus hydrogenalis]